MDLDRQAIEEALEQIGSHEPLIDDEDEGTSSSYYDTDSSSSSSCSSLSEYDREESSSGYDEKEEEGEGSGSSSSSFSSSSGLPEPRIITLKAIIIPGDKTKEGRLIEAVSIAWFEIVRRIKADPNSIYQMDCWQWEEIVAGAYKQAGWGVVVLTPRSGDKGRDVIATRNDIGAIRFVDQVKAYGPRHPVPANEVRALFGVLALDQNATKGVITTTSTFAPGIEEEFKQVIPYRLELKPKEKLIEWLTSLAHP